MIAPDDQEPLLRHIQVVSGNRSSNGSANAFRIDAVELEGLAEPVTRAVELGASAKHVDDLLVVEPNRKESRSDQARELILDILDAEGAQESDAFDARLARETGLAVGTIKNLRTKLKDDGLLKNYPDKDDDGTVSRWMVKRSNAPRP
jgi:hypothetical protein